MLENETDLKLSNMSENFINIAEIRGKNAEEHESLVWLLKRFFVVFWKRVHEKNWNYFCIHFWNIFVIESLIDRLRAKKSQPFKWTNERELIKALQQNSVSEQNCFVVSRRFIWIQFHSINFSIRPNKKSKICWLQLNCFFFFLYAPVQKV